MAFGKLPANRKYENIEADTSTNSAHADRVTDEQLYERRRAPARRVVFPPLDEYEVPDRQAD